MRYYIGVDIGGMSIKAGVVDETGRILSKKTCVTRVDEPYTVIVGDIYDLCLDAIAAAGVSKEQIAGVGMGSPGTVNSKTGVITFAANLHFEKMNIVKEFRKHWEIPTVVNNDANCAALGEAMFGGEKRVDDAIFVTLGTGVGTGFIIGGKIFEGNNGEGAEGGHICIRMGGEKCSCGERGCWEAYASATALLRQTERAAKKNPASLLNDLIEQNGLSGKVPFEAAERGDATAKRVVKKYVEYVATGLTVLINVFRPQIVMIGGGVSNAGDALIGAVERRVRRHVFGGKINTTPRIVRARLGNDAGIVGAAAPLMDE